MSKLARALALAAMLMAVIPAVAQGHAADQSASQDTRQVEENGRERLLPSPEQAAADAAHLRLLLAEQRSSIPGGTPAQVPGPTRVAESSGQPGWLIASLGVLAVLALAGGLVVAAKRANRRARVGHAA
jgi:hypothetical protein